MASNFDNFLFHIGLDEVTFFYYYLLRYLFIDDFLNLHGHGFWLLALAMFFVIDGHLN